MGLALVAVLALFILRRRRGAPDHPKGDGTIYAESKPPTDNVPTYMGAVASGPVQDYYADTFKQNPQELAAPKYTVESPRQELAANKPSFRQTAHVSELPG